MAEDPNIFEPWTDSKEELGLNQQSKSTSMSTSNPNPDTKTTAPCGEKLSKIRNSHKNHTLRAIRFHFDETPLTVLKVSREKGEYDRIRNLCLEYEAINADDTTPYLSVCPASLYSSRVGGFGNVFDPTNAIACIEGPSESPYAGGIFFLHIYFPILYPGRPMKVRFLTQIHHPSISAGIDLRLPSITTEWLPETSLQSVLLSIFSLLREPKLDDDSVPEIAKEYIDDYNGFFEKAQISTIKHASKKRLDVRKLVIDWIQDYVTFDYAVASCNKALLLWRQNIWEALPKDGSREDVQLQCVIPDSAIITISQNLRRLCTSEIRLEELDLREWGRRELYSRDHSQSSLGNTLVAVWLKLQDEKRGIEDDNDIVPGGASNDTVEACQLMFRQWRDDVWEAYPKNTFKDRESVIPDSAILTISNNLEKIGSAEDNKFCIRKSLQDVWEDYVEAREETTSTTVPEGGHGSKAEGPKSPRRLQLGFEPEKKPSPIRWVGIRSGNTRSSRSKPELRVTKSEASTKVNSSRSTQELRATGSKPGSKFMNSKSKRNFIITREDPGAKASSSNSVQGAGIAEDRLGSEIRSPNSNKGSQITKSDPDPDMQDLKSEVERLNLPTSEDDLSPMAEGSKSGQGLQATGGEETNKGLKGDSKGKGKGSVTN
ncbi:putative ubiquitin-conjugating enzyme e2 protein [Botrytis fragariae]|uniref:Putative ubiquitin-conjugating enzyme e2 protein n=1 Tax=Botrytis fragariae TaxID=1964551 RepID=A0A8H6B3H2_9HELO|nr:putative ubiquitin-conjugating enzyme e2 protein [Botrytis fragariae]KAF5878679.1 putative ubiquitin-conjugating enzyme e2 protein [Botrytis fragariae]